MMINAYASAINSLANLCEKGNYLEAKSLAETLTVNDPLNGYGWLGLGKVLHQIGSNTEALVALQKAATLAPTEADTHHYLGLCLVSLWRFEEAEASYSQALAINSMLARTHNHFGHLLCLMNRQDDALDSYRSALELEPEYYEAWNNLATLLTYQQQWAKAEACYLHAIEINQNASLALRNLGRLLEQLGGKDEDAIQYLERSIAIEPHADAYLSLGNLLMRSHHETKAWRVLSLAQTLRPLDTSPAKQAQADFSALLLDSPIAISTPIDYLTSQAPYDRHLYCLIPDANVDVDFLSAHADVIVNLITDADSGQDVLPLALDFVDQLKRPTVNHPRLIMATDRATVAERLSPISQLHIPKTIRFDGLALIKAATDQGIEDYSLPVLARLAGCHGGDDFIKCDDWCSLVKFVSLRPNAYYYLTQYVDYRSTDGYFRKYRFISVNDQLLPYHLAIHDDWMVHHFRTDMANQAWMRHEEEHFLKAPQQVFNNSQFSALQTAVTLIGLDFCGIDCALTSEGKVLIFEMNATMRVHDEKTELYAYKNPYIAQIKTAFDLMLARFAASSIKSKLRD
jgi:tetratricopeptide (TPR) repeat protein